MCELCERSGVCASGGRCDGCEYCTVHHCDGNGKCHVTNEGGVQCVADDCYESYVILTLDSEMDSCCGCLMSGHE